MVRDYVLITPARNQASLIEETFDSISRQDFSHHWDVSSYTMVTPIKPPRFASDFSHCFEAMVGSEPIALPPSVVTYLLQEQRRKLLKALRLAALIDRP